MTKEKLEEQINNGLSQRQLSKYFVLSQSTIKYYLAKYNLKTFYSVGEKVYRCKCGENDPSSFYSRNSKKCKRCLNGNSTIRFRDNKYKFLDFAGGKCSMCGYSKCPSALEFHHLDSSKKDINFSSVRGWSFERFKKEFENCILVCANCHRELHSC